MGIKFVSLPGQSLPGNLGYDDGSQTYWFEPTTPVALAGSLVAQFLQIYLEADTIHASWVSGRSGQPSWVQRELGEPPSKDGPVRVAIESEPLLASAAIEVPNAWNWVSAVDPVTRWFRCGASDQSDLASFVTIATGTVLELEGDDLTGVWLRPSSEGD